MDKIALFVAKGGMLAEGYLVQVVEHVSVESGENTTERDLVLRRRWCYLAKCAHAETVLLWVEEAKFNHPNYLLKCVTHFDTLLIIILCHSMMSLFRD